MTSASGRDSTLDEETRRPSTLVWIDSRQALIVRWADGVAGLARTESDVPPHHKATGHVRHDPLLRHGGGGVPQTAGEPHRLEHLNRFVAQIANQLPPGGDLLILGPGTAHERLERLIAQRNAHNLRQRRVVCESSPPLTERQLVARLRAFAGVETRRRTVGAYRWAGVRSQGRSGKTLLPPRRVVEKPPHEIDHDGP
jgi:hypothetical protein